MSIAKFKTLKTLFQREKDVNRAQEIRDKLNHKGRKETNHFSREIDQWLKKMRCTGATGQRLEKFRDIKVGVLPEDVEYKSASLEPYLSFKNHNFKFRGGRDKDGKFKGKGVIEFENGDIISGTFKNGMRHGECRIETFKNNMRVLIGNYERDMLNGKAKITYNDDNWMEGYFKDGVLHGFARHFDEKGRLKFLGNYRNGKAFGVCWKIIKGGGSVVGRVDDAGELTGIRIAYLYPDFKTAIVGNFTDAILDHGKVAVLKTVIEDRGIKVPIFTEPGGPDFIREIATYDLLSSTPLLPDPYESQMVEVRQSRVPGSGDGLFAKLKVEPNTILAFYNGKRIKPMSWEDQDFNDWNKNAYRIFDPASKVGTLDIPAQFRASENYCASLAHKTNHSFLPNAEFVAYTHPRFGLVPCIMASHDIEAGEEIFVHYGYDLDGCPEWYEEAWLKGNYPIPDSMKDSWANNVAESAAADAQESEKDCSTLDSSAEGSIVEEDEDIIVSSEEDIISPELLLKWLDISLIIPNGEVSEDDFESSGGKEEVMENVDKIEESNDDTEAFSLEVKDVEDKSDVVEASAIEISDVHLSDESFPVKVSKTYSKTCL